MKKFIPKLKLESYRYNFLFLFAFCSNFITQSYAQETSLVSPEWAARFTSSGHNVAEAMAVDEVTGDVYVTGSTWDNSKGQVIGVVKYDKEGKYLWDKKYTASNGLASAIAAKGGVVYVAGRTLGAAVKGTAFNDYTLLKFNSNGNILSEATYSGGVGNDGIFAMAVEWGTPNKIYVTGRSTYQISKSGVGSFQIASLKYTDEGTLVHNWTKTYRGSSNSGNHEASAIAVRGNSVYVCGFTTNSNGNTDYVTIKYDEYNGSEKWTQTYDRAGKNDAATAIALDESKGIYVTGNTTGSGLDITTIKYEDGSAELQKWVNTFHGGSGNDEAKAIAYHKRIVTVDDEETYIESVFVAGRTQRKINNKTTYNEFLTLKYNADGSGEIKSQLPGGTDSGANAIAVDSQGNVWVTGYTTGSRTGKDFRTIKYNSSLESPKERIFHASAEDIAVALVVSGSNVFVAGKSRSSSNNLDYLTLNYFNTSPGLTSNMKIFEREMSFKAYPMPFSDQATIQIAFDQDEHFNLELYDLKGNLVQTLKEGRAGKGELLEVEINGNALPKGLYTARLSTSAGYKTLRLLLQK